MELIKKTATADSSIGSQRETIETILSPTDYDELMLINPLHQNIKMIYDLKGMG